MRVAVRQVLLSLVVLSVLLVGPAARAEHGELVMDADGGSSSSSSSDSGSSRSLLSVPKQGLNSTNDCNNKMCYYLETALSCKALGFNISKICARYLLGYLYACDAFPPPAQFFNAPSVCIPELLALLPPSAAAQLKGIKASGAAFDLSALSGLQPSMNLTKRYLAGSFHDNCRRTCFQRYIAQANTFYSSCDDQLARYANATNQNSLYPLVYKLEGYAEFRNQVCAQNATGQNCYDALSSINPVTAKQPPAYNILDPTCNYLHAANAQDWGLNQLVLQGVCAKLKPGGCCAANQAAMLAQSQTNASASATYNTKTVYSAIKLFPPCLMNFLAGAQCGIKFGDFCTDGANGNVTTITGKITMDQSGGKMPNVYNLQQLTTLQGVISLNLPGFDISKTKAPVLQVEITSFAYFNSTAAQQGPASQLTPADGTTYFPSQGDYAAAQSGSFSFLIAVQGLDQAGSDALYNALTQAQTCHPGARGEFSTLLAVYGATSRASCVVDPMVPVLAAEPLSLPPKNAAGAGAGGSPLALLLACLLGAALLL